MLFFLTSTMYRCLIIIIGVLYPAFNSYKALNRRNGYDQVKWMMYWIVFAAFTTCEVVTDLFLSWLPLYYESKIVLVLWMVLPMSRGSSYLYRRIIHPNLLKHEQDIDRYIAAASNSGCEVLLQFGQHGMNYAANAVLRTADHLKRSYSLGDISRSNAAIEACHNNYNEVFQENMSLASTAESNYEQQMSRTTRNTRQRQAASTNKKNSTPNKGSTTRRTKKALQKLDEEC